MKQLIQSLKTGQTILENVPVPQVKPGFLLIQTSRTLVSLGTERTLVEFGKASLINKARQQPERLKEVFDKMGTDGIRPTLDAVFNKLGQPLPLGYCNVGTVAAVGAGVHGFKLGDRVASNGPHAEFVCVPKNLTAIVPDVVSDEEAAFTVMGSIGLQGIRLAEPSFGECFAVIGLGLIGLLTAQLLKANGARVFGLDLDVGKLELARQFGIIPMSPKSGSDPVKRMLEETNGIGVDGVLITASSKDHLLMHQAAQMTRKRGRIILIGVVGLHLDRSDFYEKEITFRVSCSYGPGRYDSNYEEQGNDYPIGFVRWTEKRNFEAVLQAISRKQIDVLPLITERVPLEDFRNIYENMNESGSVGSILVYDKNVRANKTVNFASDSFRGTKGVLGIIGSGNFTSATLLPALRKLKPNVKYIASAGGVTAVTLAKKFGIANATSDYKEILSDPDVDLVLITTRHNLHARMIVESLAAGKHVFVEKPLALNESELREIIEAKSQFGKTINVGFNRRFSPFAQRMRILLGDGQMNVVATMNAGYIPDNAWVHDFTIGGGRIIGEACHFIDLCSYLARSKVTKVFMNAMGNEPAETTDNASILLKYANGSNAVINYFSNGTKSYPKERIEVFSLGRVCVLDNWRKLTGYGFKGFSHLKSRMDKGHNEQFRLLLDAVRHDGSPLIPFDDIINTTAASFAAIESLRTGEWVELS
ncbi:dehydrogenase [bacterium]|nr:MAG: dehydrogenase [bacterium]